MSTVLLALPPEVLSLVLCSLDPSDVEHFAQASSVLRSFVYSNDVLWQSLFLDIFDYPPNPPALWRTELVRRLAAARFLLTSAHSAGVSVSTIDCVRFEETLALCLEILSSADPSSSSKNILFLDVLFGSPAVQNLCFHSSIRSHKSSASSKLHAFYGPTKLDISDPESRGRAREIVYRAHNYGSFNNWGPFNPDSTVDWHIVESIASLMHRNSSRHFPSTVSGFNFARPHMIQGGKDWAGITGTEWTGVYAFLNFPDFFAYNFLQSSLDSLPNQEEIVTTGLHLKVLSTITDNGGSTDHPILHFQGSTRTADIRGTVKYTPDKQVRWSYIISYNGGDQWQLEGVQIGGIKSAAGVLGIWTSVFHERESSCGPFALWPSGCLKYEAV